MRVGLVGAGTVGGGVCEILRLRAEALKRQGVEFNIVKICVRDVSRKRDFDFPAGAEIVSDPNAIIQDDSIEMVIELMGGVTIAKDVVFGAIAKGKHVVTGNKALIGICLPEIQAALKANPKASFSYEPAVCGGIPIINALRNDYVGDEITSIMGIMNGTTNFILSKMEAEGAAYGDVLAEAQRLGYAETPPDFDVEGWDARSKLLILIKLAFGIFVPEDTIPCTGITRITSEDFKYAQMMKSTVKILGVASRNDDGTVSAYLSPCIVPFTSQLSRVSGVLNCVAVKSKNLNVCHYMGPGAGRFATGNSVVNDMVAVAKAGRGADPFPVHSDATFAPEVLGCFYVRFLIKDHIGIIVKLSTLAEAEGISINAILQTPIQDPSRVPFVMTTNSTTLSAVKRMCEQFGKYDFNLEQPFIMPILPAVS